MYNNVGSKIKKITQTFTTISIILIAIACLSLISGFEYMFGGFGALLIVSLIFVILSGLVWLSSLILYAFGDLVENTKNIAIGLGFSQETAELNLNSSGQEVKLDSSNQKIKKRLDELKSLNMISDEEYEEKLKKLGE